MPADVQIRCISLTTKGKARRRGDISRVRKTLSEIEMSVDLFFIEKEEGRGDSCLPSSFACRRSILIKNSGSARESAGNNIKKGVHVAAAPARAAGSASTTKERIHFR